MNTVKCCVGECPSTFQTEVALSPNAKYVCKLHTKREQEAFFQIDQFDKDLRRGRKPMGTSHVANQGSEVLTSEEVEAIYGWQHENV